LRKQFKKNVLINVFSFVSTILIGLWLTPYLIEKLGLVAYGLIPLAMFFSQYIGVIINSINMSINRFLLIALQQNKNEEANSIFSTSLIIISVFIIVQAIIMLLILININTVFTIPIDLLNDATWLFGLTFIGFSISLLRSVYGTSLFAYNRLDILRTIDVIQNVARVSIIVFFYWFDQPSLYYIGLANLISAMLAFIPTVIYFKKFTPQLTLKMNNFDKSKVADLSKMSTWVLVNQVGALLLGNIDLYLVNKLLGSEQTGSYAIVTQVTSLFRTLATLIAGVIAPVIMIYHANNELEKLKKVLILSAKFMILLVVPIALFVGFSEDLIGLWLGDEYKYLYSLISFSLLFYIVAIPMMPLYNVNVAFNKVKTPALVVIVLGFINLGLIYALLSYSDLNLWAVVIVKLVIEILFAGIFMPIYVSRILSIKLWKLFSIPITSTVVFLVVYGAVTIVQEYLLVNTFTQIIIYSIVIGLMIVILFIRLILNKEERTLAFENIKIKSIMKK